MAEKKLQSKSFIFLLRRCAIRPECVNNYWQHLFKNLNRYHLKWINCSAAFKRLFNLFMMHQQVSFRIIFFFSLLLLFCGCKSNDEEAYAQWRHYAGTPDGNRYSSL